jgi:uncharacterized protein (DUF924 family)
VAKIVLCDQIPRRIFRNKVESFNTDSIALATTFRVLEKGWDQGLHPAYKLFLYQPVREGHY